MIAPVRVDLLKRHRFFSCYGRPSGLWQTVVSEVLIHDLQVLCVGCAIVIEIKNARLTCETPNAATILPVHALIQVTVAGTGGLGGEDLIERPLELLVVCQLLSVQIRRIARDEQISLIESDKIISRRLEIVELEFTLEGNVAGLTMALHELVTIVSKGPSFDRRDDQIGNDIGAHVAAHWIRRDRLCVGR